MVLSSTKIPIGYCKLGTDADPGDVKRAIVLLVNLIANGYW